MGVRRTMVAFGVGALLVAIYAVSYVYFTDRADYGHIGLQMARYALPLAVLAAVAWSPRALIPAAGRIDRRWALVAVALVPTVGIGASVVTWLWTGANTPLG